MAPARLSPVLERRHELRVGDELVEVGWIGAPAGVVAARPRAPRRGRRSRAGPSPRAGRARRRRRLRRRARAQLALELARAQPARGERAEGRERTRASHRGLRASLPPARRMTGAEHGPHVRAPPRGGRAGARASAGARSSASRRRVPVGEPADDGRRGLLALREHVRPPGAVAGAPASPRSGRSASASAASSRPPRPCADRSVAERLLGEVGGSERRERGLREPEAGERAVGVRLRAAASASPPG